MGRFGILAFNTFEEALRRKVIYILLFVALIVGIRAIYQLVYMGMAEYAGDTELLTDMRGQFVLSIFGMMEFCGVLLSVFLGAVALSAEVKNRTVVPVLSRPVGRVSFFFAKWIGTLAFLAMFVGVGVVTGLGVALYWELHPSLLFAFGIAEILLEVAVVSAVSLALSSVFHPVLAGGGALVLVFLHELTAPLAWHPSQLASYVVSSGRYLSPARSPVSFLESGLVKGLLEPDYGLYLSVLAENAGYALAAALAGALVFRHRELRVRLRGLEVSGVDDEEENRGFGVGAVGRRAGLLRVPAHRHQDGRHTNDDRLQLPIGRTLDGGDDPARHHRGGGVRARCFHRWRSLRLRDRSRRRVRASFGEDRHRG